MERSSTTERPAAFGLVHGLRHAARRRFPALLTALSEVPSTTHPLGMRGGGEGGITPALGVIVNAVVDALAEFGVTHIDMPALARAVWQAIRAASVTPA